MTPKAAVTAEVVPPSTPVSFDLLKLPDTKDIVAESTTLLARLPGYTITTDEQFVEAGDLLEKCKRLRTRAEDRFAETVAAWFKGHRASSAARNTLTDPITRFETIIKTQWSAYKRKKDAEAETERKRLEEEAKAKAEATKLDTAIAFEAAGQQSEADAIINDPTPAVIVTPAAAPSVPKVEGISTTRKYRGVITDPKAIIRSVAAGQAPDTLVAPDQSAINKFAQATKGSMIVPGIRFEYDDVPVNNR
jgi:hypothetical protein